METLCALGCALLLVGGPTVVLEVDGVRLVTDPTFDPAGTRYVQGPVEMTKTAGPALSPEELGAVDAVLLSHDEHLDNLDHAGRAFVASAGLVLTTPAGARRLKGSARGLAPWESTVVTGRNGRRLRVTAVPARHGPPGSEPLLGEVTGFVIERADTRGGGLYVSGDTVWFDELAQIKARLRPAAGILHMGDAHFAGTGEMQLTLDAETALRLTRSLELRTVVPIHLDGWAHYRERRAAVEQRFRAASAGETLLSLEPGKPAPLTTPRRQ